MVNVPFQMTIVKFFIEMWTEGNSFATADNAILFWAIDAKELLKNCIIFTSIPLCTGTAVTEKVD